MKQLLDINSPNFLGNRNLVKIIYKTTIFLAAIKFLF